MKQQSVSRRLLATFLSAILVVALLPFGGFGAEVSAAVAADKTVVCLGARGIKAPSAANVGDASWKGSYVWYGKYDGNPVKYRVLATNLTKYGATSMLLDCDTILYVEPFDADGEINEESVYLNEWANSDIKAGLNGSKFLNKQKGFTDQEKTAILASKIASHALSDGTGAGQVSSWTAVAFGDFVALNGEKIFLLDVEDASNSAFGYNSDDAGIPGRVKNYSGEASAWWLRSGDDIFDDNIGMIRIGGMVDTNTAVEEGGVSPAFNINRSYVIFSSLVTGTAGQDGAEYKLTLKDSNLVVALQNNQPLTSSGNKVSLNYTVSGSDAANATRLSVVILDKPYTAGNSNGATIKYYGKMDTTAASGTALALTGTASFTLPSDLAMSGWGSSYHVYMLAEDENGMHETDYASAPVKLSAPGVPVIQTQPKDVSANVGDTATFTVAATGNGTLSYQWQSRKDSSASWANSGLSGAKTKTLSVAAQAGLDGYQFRCVIKDANGKQTISNAATLSIDLKITTQPKNVSALVGTTGKFTVAASGKATLTYQWQSRKNSSSNWANSGLSGAKTATLSVTASAGLNGYQFRCVVKDGKGKTLNSNAATLTVTTNLAISTQPKSVSADLGATAKFGVIATGTEPLTYQWQSRKNSSASWANSGLSGAKTAYLSVTAQAGLDGYQFRCIIKDANGKTVTSNTATLSINVKIKTQPQNAETLAGSTAKFGVAATGVGTLTYQWQSRKNSSASWADSGQSGAKTAYLSVAASAGLNGWQFRCIVTDSRGKSVTSNAATLSIVPIVITSQPASTSAAAGAIAKFSVAASTSSSGALMYQWQSRKNSSAEWTNSGQSGAKTKTLSVTTNNGLDGWQFRCIVKDASGNQKISESATLTISPKITKQPANVNATVGYAAKFSVSVTGSGSLTYKWQSRKNASANWAASGLSGADTATLSVTASAGLNGYQFRCVITDAYGNQSISDGATLSIVPIMITTQPKSVSTTAGSTAKFGVIANGTGLTYQWQSRKNSSASWSNSGQSGAKTAYVSVAASAGLNSWQFRCIITDANGNKLESNEATLTVK